MVFVESSPWGFDPDRELTPSAYDWLKIIDRQVAQQANLTNRSNLSPEYLKERGIEDHREKEKPQK